jgi:signal transduction histidine kinase
LRREFELRYPATPCVVSTVLPCGERADARGIPRGRQTLGERMPTPDLTDGDPVPECAPSCPALLDVKRRLAEHRQRSRRLASELVLAEERQRRVIAEDLHDHLGQGLALLRLKLHELQADAVFCGLDHALDDMDTLLAQAIRYTRSLTNEISPPVLYELGLSAAIEALAESVGRKQGLSIVVTGEVPPTLLPQPVQVVLYRSLRELMHNVVKHARAKRVQLRFSVVDETFTVTVKDDGVGFSTQEEGLPGPAHPGSGFGLFCIRERLHDLGGGLQILSEPGRGAELRLELPLVAEET